MEEQIDMLKEEQFCMNLELNTLSDVLLRNESERWVPGFLFSSTEKSHYDRYYLAKNFCKSKKVIDIACGTGKGSFILATEGQAESVYAIDIDKDAIRYAKWRNNNEKICHLEKNAEQIDFVSEFDLAVSFETIEHLNNYEKFLENINKALISNGLFIVSTPISSLDVDNKPQNPYHVQEWGFLKFQEIIKKHFSIEKVFVQIYPETLRSYKLEKAISKSFSKRLISILSRITKKIINSKKKDQLSIENASVIEEYIGQYSDEDFKTPNVGYQIILAKKNN